MASSSRDQQSTKQSTTRSSTNNARSTSARQAQGSGSSSSSTAVPETIGSGAAAVPQAQNVNPNANNMQLSLANAMQMMGGGLQPMQALQPMQLQLQHMGMPMQMQTIPGMPMQTVPGMQMTTTTGPVGVGAGISKAARQVVPAFLQKLYEMVNDPNNAELIRWSEAGDSFFVLDHERFAHEVLGRWFKHKNFSSFVRQLNMYGFHKIPHLQQGVLKSDSQETEFWNFAHANFHRGQPDLLCLIQRKKQVGGGVASGGTRGDDGGAVVDIRGAGGDGNVGMIAGSSNPDASSSSSAPAQNPFASSSNTSSAPSTAQPPTLTSTQLLDIHSIVSGITAIKRHQTTISAELNQLKQSNQMLWQDAIAARARHQKQQDTINRIVKFLAGVFGQGAGAAGGAGAGPGAMASAMGAFAQGGPGGGNNGSAGSRSNSGAGSDKGAPHVFGGRRRMRLMIEDAKRDSTAVEKEKAKTQTGGSGVVKELRPDGMDIDDILDMDTDARLEELEDELNDDQREEDDEASGHEGDGEGHAMFDSSYDYPTIETPGSMPSPAVSDGTSLAVVDASPSPSPAPANAASSKSVTTDLKSNTNSSKPSPTKLQTQTQNEQGKQLSRSVTPSSRFPHAASGTRTPTNAVPGSSGNINNGPTTMFELDPRISGVFNHLTPSQIQQLLASLAAQGVGGGLDTSSNSDGSMGQGFLNPLDTTNPSNASDPSSNANSNETTSGPVAPYVHPTSYDFSLNPATFSNSSESSSGAPYSPYGFVGMGGMNTMNGMGGINPMNFNADDLIPFEGYDPSATDTSNGLPDDGAGLGLGMGFDFGGGDVNALGALSPAGSGAGKSLQQQQHEERMQRQWLAAEDIDKDVNALNSSINSLIQTFGLDVGLLDDDDSASTGATAGSSTAPGTGSSAVAGNPVDENGTRNNEGSTSTAGAPTDGEGKDFDFDMFFNNLSSMPVSMDGINPVSGMGAPGGMNANTTAGAGINTSTHNTGMDDYMTSAFLDEVRTPSSLASDHPTPKSDLHEDLEMGLDGVVPGGTGLNLDAAIGGMKASAARGTASMPSAGGLSTNSTAATTASKSGKTPASLTATASTVGKKRKSGVDLEDLFASKMDVVDDPATPVPASSVTGRTTRTRSGTTNGASSGSIAVSRPKRRKDK